MTQPALFEVTYDVEREFDGFKVVYLSTPSWDEAVKSAKYEVENNHASYYAVTRIRNAGIVLEEFASAPGWTSSFKGD